MRTRAGFNRAPPPMSIVGVRRSTRVFLRRAHKRPRALLPSPSGSPASPTSTSPKTLTPTGSAGANTPPPTTATPMMRAPSRAFRHTSRRRLSAPCRRPCLPSVQLAWVKLATKVDLLGIREVTKFTKEATCLAALEQHTQAAVLDIREVELLAPLWDEQDKVDRRTYTDISNEDLLKQISSPPAPGILRT